MRKRKRTDVEQSLEEHEHGTPVEVWLVNDERYQELAERERSTAVRTWRNLLHAARGAPWL